MEIKKIGVVGAGTMGNGIAQAFAVCGYDVVMTDIAGPPRPWPGDRGGQPRPAHQERK